MDIMMETEGPVIHSYASGSDDDDSFISIPDESYSIFPPSPPAQRKDKQKKKTHEPKNKSTKPLVYSAQAEVITIPRSVILSLVLVCGRPHPH